MKFLWIISHGPTYWFEHTDQGDEDPLGSFLAFPWQPPPVFCTALILIYNFEWWQFNKGGSNCCSFDLRQTKVSAHHLSVHGHVCKLETCSKRVQNFSGIGDKQNQYFGTLIRGSIPEGKRKAYMHSCFATSAKCTGNHDLFLLLLILSTVTLFSFDRHLCGFACDLPVSIDCRQKGKAGQSHLCC